MLQKDLYLKDIFRPIEGVIKAQDDKHLLLELEEYVLTNELLGKSKGSRMLPGLFEDLAKGSLPTSIWISGYFGSGKSHLLKMLSMVLENKEINGLKCADVFASKAKDDFELESNIRKASKIPTQSILFNISAKSDGVIGLGNTTDKVLSIFLKVFNELLGYDPLNPEIAEIERHLESIGKYAFFKEEYYRRNLKNWEKGREHIFLNQHELAAIYADIKSITAEEANKFIDNLINNYKLDINTFCDLVAKYIDTQPKGFRLIFCVDEVGQFIAENVNLMLSLQTIVETLSTKTNGQSFLIVTSQNDINAVIGELNKQQAHDFSRIQGRFAIKIPLTSANADEVIQKRLLKKNEAAEKMLEAYYEKDQHNIRTLLKFTDDIKQNQSYKDANHFATTFPFVPYQFDLFQASIRALSDQNAFMGSHQSVGERSMLGVFQQVAKTYASKDVESIVSFAHLYEGIRDVLQGNIQSDILQAQKSIASGLANDVLKALFLVKYIKGFNATMPNISILLLPKFEVDLSSFHKQVQEALNLLENQVYIQRAANDTYEYLTNQEKDVENDIKNIEIDPTAAGDLLADILFENILSSSKVKLDSNNQVYEYGRKLDDALVGKERDFYLHFVSPLNPLNAININMYSAGRPNDMVVLLPDNNRLNDDLRLIKKTEKYVMNVNSPNLDATKQRIIVEKAQHNVTRKQTIIQHLREGIGDARMYINGSEVTDIGSKDPRTKIPQGMQQVIRMIYPNLTMLPVDFSEDQLPGIIQSKDDVLFKSDLHESELEVLTRIQRNTAIHERTTIKNLLEHFNGRPFGWYQAAILCLIARLYKRNKISIKLDGSTLDDRRVLESLIKSNQYQNTIIEPEEDIPGPQVQKLKKFHQEYFNEPNLGNDPKEISRLFKIRLKTEIDELAELNAMRTRFKFLEAVGEPLSRLRLLYEKEHIYFFTAQDNYQEDVMDDKENVLDPIKKFMGGAQKSIFENVLIYLDGNQANFEYINKSHLDVLHLVAESQEPYKGNQMQSAKASMDAIKHEIEGVQKEEREKAIVSIRTCMDNLKSIPEYGKLKPNQQEDVITPLAKAIADISGEKFIGNIRAKSHYTSTDLFQKQVERVLQLSQPIAESVSASSTSTESKSIYVRKDTIKVDFKKHAIETHEDLEAYLGAVRVNYKQVIDDNKKILLQ